jgi:hypothetical protein
MDPNAILERHLQKPERIRVPELRLDPERLLGQRFELDAEPLPQALALEALELRPWQRLKLGLEDRHGSDYCLSASAIRIDPKEAACAHRSLPSRRPE